MALTVQPRKPVTGWRRATNPRRVDNATGTTIPLTVSPDGRLILSRRLDRAGTIVLNRSVTGGANLRAPDAGTIKLPTDQDVQLAEYLTNGELLVSTHSQWAPGQIWVSEGWARNPLTATWTQTLTTGGPPGPKMGNGVAIRRWGFDQAPKGHVRDGLIVTAEYGAQSVEGESSVDGGPNAVYLSVDWGKTWRKIFNLFQQRSLKNQHMHGCAYDPWTDAVLICYGDGFAGPPAVSGIEYALDWLNPEDQITWRGVVGPYSNADYQVTGMYSVPEGVLLGSDGGPDGINLIPRAKGDVPYGKPYAVMPAPNQNSIWTVKHPAGASKQHPLFWQQNGVAGQQLQLVEHVPPGELHTLWETQAAVPAYAIVQGGAGPDRDGWYHWSVADAGAESGLYTARLVTVTNDGEVPVTHEYVDAPVSEPEPAPEPGSATVLYSDSFSDVGAWNNLLGRRSDSFAGGQQVTWTVVANVDQDNPRIEGAAGGRVEPKGGGYYLPAETIDWGTNYRARFDMDIESNNDRLALVIRAADGFTNVWQLYSSTTTEGVTTWRMHGINPLDWRAPVNDIVTVPKQPLGLGIEVTVRDAEVTLRHGAVTTTAVIPADVMAATRPIVAIGSDRWAGGKQSNVIVERL